MKTKKLLARLKTYMDADQRAQVKQADALKDVLAKLKKKERQLRDKVADCDDDQARKKLELKLAVCHAQRKKGLALLKQIKAEK
jgi:hypothetical protein